MDSSIANIKEIPSEAAENAESTPTETNTTNTQSVTKNTLNINTNANVIATTSGNATTNTVINYSNQETDLAAMSKDLEIEESFLENMNDTMTNSSASCLLSTSYNSISAPDTTIAPRTTTTTTKPTSFNQFVTPQKSENKSIQLHASASTTSSLKKKRNKFSKCLGGNKNHTNNNKNKKIIGCGATNGDNDSSSSLSNVVASNIKTSISMTSLPPNEKQEGRDGIKAKLKVERPYNSLKKNADRNLTNQLANMHLSKSHAGNSTNACNRNSWGSGYSSSSLQSSAATLGIGSGKDDLWAAIQTNYNYIMDTNLLDTCKEARCEIEGTVSVLDFTLDKSFKLLDDNNRNVGSYEDPKELRKWLRDMEHKLENSPTLSEATMLTCSELESHLNEHSVLYHEIVSHARVVSACIRAASEKEQKQHKQSQQQQHDSYNTDASLIAEQTNSSLSSTDDTTTTNTNTTTSTNTTTVYSSSSAATTSGVVCSTATTLSDHQISLNTAAATSPAAATSVHTSKKSDNSSLERLQNRYHLLYLKAFEVQLWLDGLLRKKSSSVGNLTNEDLDSEDIDDSIDYSDDCSDDINANDKIDGATEDDLNDVASDLESDITHNSLSYNDDLQQPTYNIHQQQQQQQRLQHHHKKQAKQQQKHQLCHSSDIDENQTINVSSHHLQSSRDCIQNKIECEDGDDNEDEVEIEEEAEDGDDEDEIDSPNYKNRLGYTKLLVTFDRSSGRSSAAGQHKTSVTLTDFEADSESSDLETIQRCMRSCNQRNSNKMTHYTPMSCKFLTNNSSGGLITGHHTKRSTICGSVTTVNSVGINAVINNATSELESYKVDDMETVTPKAITATLLTENLPYKCQQQQQHHQQYLKLQQKQRATLMAITKNAMTTGSTTTTTATNTATQSLGSTIATSTTNNNSVNLCNSYSVSGNNSDSMSNISSIGVTATVNANGQSNNNIVTTKLLADNESNQQHHLKHHQQQNQQQLHQHQHQHKINGGFALKQKNIAIISPISHKNFNNKHQQNHHHHYHKNNNNNNNNNNKSPTVLRKHHEHHHSSDISKFNRSNRKSKNCAIFYFKHLDTDNETNYSNSNCGDDGHDDCHVNADGGCNSDGLVANEHCYEDVNGVGVGAGAGVDDDDDNDEYHCNDNIVGGLLLSSAASSSHTSDLLKSADASSDDECWLYTSSPVATNQQQQHSFGGIESLNSNHTARGIATTNELHSVDGDIQSSTVSSSTAATSVAAATAATVTLSDDSDKENKEVKDACTISLAQTQTLLTTNQTFVASTTVIDGNNDDNINAVQLASNSGNPSSNSSISSVISSSCSSNDRLTEATTATSTKTITTQILKYTTQQQQQQQGNPAHYRSEMELQINSNNNIRHQIMMKDNILSTTANNKSTLATNMPDLVINHKNGNCINSNNNNNNNGNNNNNNCANSSSSLISNSLQHKRNHHCAAKTSSSSSLQNSAATTTITADNDVNGNFEKETIRFYTRADICNMSARTPNQSIDNNHHQHQHQQLLANVNGTPASSLYGAQHLLHLNVGKRLPPRSPAKSSISHTSTNTSTSTISPTKGKVSHESIKQLVLEAEHLVRDEALKTPTKQKHSSSSNNNNNNNNAGGGNIVQISTTVKKREAIMPGPIKRVQEWLEHQPATPVQMQKSSITHHHTSDEHHRLLSVATNSNAAPSPTRTDDCEASGEASENDSIPQQCSDTSEVSDSIATCMQTSTNSYGNSTERIGGSAEPIVNAATSNQSLNVKIVKRQQNRRKSERPWSVSCLSQLTTDANQVAAKVKTISNVHSGLASHSISESALDSLSPGRPRASSSSAVTQVKSYDSKGSLKRRKTRKKKLSVHINGKKSDTNSEDNNNHQHHHAHYGHHPTTHQEAVTLTPKQPPTLLMQTCENMTPQQIQEITQALIQLQNPNSTEQLQMAAGILQQHQQLTTVVNGTTNESEEENQLMKPNFRVGSFTTAYMTNEARLGSLAALATYMNDEDQQAEYNTTGTEDHHSSFSETAWDNYQEKYNSENYSEGFDSDAARKLLEFGDDYRNFIDSQSDCCSSLSAANNLDSFSPPRMDSLQQNESKIITQDTIVSSVDHARRRRALELEYERRRKNLEIRRKSCQESLEYHNPKSPAATLSSSTQALTPKNSERFNFQHKTETATRKLEFGMSHSAQSLRRTSESDTSQRRRKADERRRSSRNLEKCIKLIPATSSSSGDDTDDEKEIRNLLQQSHNRLEDTKALKIRCHLLRPEDYTEIISTCRDNIRCLESVLKGPTSSVLSSQCVTQSKDLLAAWEDLLGWSENAAAARKLQEDMIVLKHALNRLGNKSSFELLDTEPSIQIAIEALKSEKTQLQTYRTSMLKLNASVHSWLTRQERRLQNALVEQQLNEAAVKVAKELLEEEGEIKSEHKSTTVKQQTATTAAIAAASKQTMQEQIVHTTTGTKTETATTATTTMITITDNNGNELESHTGTATNTVGTSTSNTTTTQHHGQQLMHSSSSCSGSEKNWDLQSLIASETEFHKHLKDEVSDMYTAWDEADARINSQLEVLTSSLIAWRQLECGLSEFQLALGQDRGTLKGLEGALNTGQATPGELAQNVKLVAKLLSEKVNVSQEQLTAVQDYLDPNHILHIAKYTASNGSLSDSGISDGGATSDGGLSERERRLGVLRRLAKQLESALAPGSEAMKSIAARMESAENELKSLQNTCRDLIVRTAASHQNKKHQEQLQEQQDVSEKRKVQNEEIVIIQPRIHQTNGQVKIFHDINGKMKQTTGEGDTSTTAHGLYTSRDSGKRNKRRNRHNSSNSNAASSAGDSQSNALQMKSTAAGDGGGDDPSDEPHLGYDLDTSDDELTPKSKKGWGWRIAKIAVPMQLALFAVYCAANLMQPNCCDNINNFSMSFTPQLRYIRGPPPI